MDDKKLQTMRLQNSISFHVIFLLVFTTCCIVAFFIWEGHIGLNLSDESFLWYGAAAVSHGKVPIRDFYAYDPGRYYLTAFMMKLLGNDGIITSRIAEAVIQGIGLFLALFMLIPKHKLVKKIDFFYFFLTNMILLIWMAPLYKIFDITASILLIAMLTYLIETNTLFASFLTGIGVASVAILGRNHGIYGVAASSCLLIYLSLTTQRQCIFSALTWWGTGLLVGYMPIIMMLLFIPGFSYAFFKSIHFLFVSKSTNLFLPIPWPWQAATFQDFILGIFFISILLFGLCCLTKILLPTNHKNKSPVYIACAFLAAPYAHYAFSRADSVHLALGIFPFLIGLFSYLGQIPKKLNIIRFFTIIILFSFSLIIALPIHPGAQAYHDPNWQYLNITGSKLKIDLDGQIKIAMFERLISQYAKEGQSFLVVPFNFGLYSVFGRESPMWDLYPLFPRSLDDQAADIVKIKKANPSFVVIYDYALDGKETRQFHYTHALIFKYIVENFELIHDKAEIPNLYIYKRKI